MSETALDERGYGDNQAPSDANPIRERLTETHAGMLSRRDELLAASNRVPTTVEDENTARKVGDFIKQLQAAVKNADATRVAEKEPYLDGGRQTDGFFKAITEPLAKAKKDIEGRLGIFLRKKADAERRAREEAERKAREEAERAARAAAEAEAAMTDDAAVEEAVVAEQRAKDAADVAAKAQVEAEAKAADLSRTRGDYGSVASLRTFWDFKDLDRNKLALEPLRSHLSVDALEKAVRSYVKAGERKLAGVTIFENTSTTVR